MCISMCLDMCIGIYIDIFLDMCSGIRIDRVSDTCMCVCIDMLCGSRPHELDDHYLLAALGHPQYFVSIIISIEFLLLV